jgi:hypothetical protein
MGGGSSSIDVPSLGQTLGEATSGFRHDVFPTFQKFTQQEPLIRQLSQMAPGLAQTGQGFVNAAAPYLTQIIAAHGALTPEERNLVTQQARGAFQARGNVIGNQAIGAELLNRDVYRWQKLQQAMGMAGQTLGLAGQTEQLLGYPEAVRTGSFATLMNPIYGLAGQELQASTAAQSAANAQNKGGTQTALGTGLSLVSSAAAAY